MGKKDKQECVWECRKTKITLEHEVLMREMDALLIGEVGIPITTVTLILTSEIDRVLAIIICALLATVMVFFDYLRSDKKEKIVKKQKELDCLIAQIEEESIEKKKP